MEKLGRRLTETTEQMHRDTEAVLGSQSENKQAHVKPMKKITLKCLSVILPKKLVDYFHTILAAISWKQAGGKEIERFDYYALSTAFMLDCIKKSNRDFSQLSILSVGCRAGYLVGILPIFDKVLHSTMVGLEGVEEISTLNPEINLHQVVGDFFELTPGDISPLSKGIDVILSHATIHCMADSRYDNDQANDQWGGRERPYSFARKVRSLTDARVAVIFSCAVSNEERLVDDAGWLSHQKLTDSFIAEDFTLKRVLFDKQCGRFHSQDPNNGPRVVEELPLDYLKSHNYVIGNYYFEG